AVDRLVKKVDAPLRQPLKEALERRVRDRTLPETVDSLTLRGKPYLYLKRMPPPKPPEAELAGRIAQAPRARREAGREYPVPFRELLDETARGAEPKVLKKALAHDAYQPHVVRVGKDVEAPVALTEDQGRLAASDATLAYALGKVTTPRRRTATLGQLAET